MSKVKFPAIERPNGKLYRPRTIQPIGLGYDEITDILVLGTHDVRYAEIIAAPELERLSNEFEYDDLQLKISGPGKQVWKIRELVGWDGDYDGPNYCYSDNPEHGRAGVMFPVEPTERAAE